MHIWTIEKWKKLYDLSETSHRTGTRIKFEIGVHPEVRRACKEFLKWARSEYFFPVRVNIYVKAKPKVKSIDGEMVSATCFLPDDRQTTPYIKISAGDYDMLLKNIGQDNALAAILGSIAHELTHYFQWINGLQLTRIGEERQATCYRRFIINEYSETREHP